MVYCDNNSKIISDAVMDNPTVVIKLQIRKPNCCKKYKKTGIEPEHQSIEKER